MPIRYGCPECGGERILFDAWAVWNPAKEDFELDDVYEDYESYCMECEVNVRPEKVEVSNDV